MFLIIIRKFGATTITVVGALLWAGLLFVPSIAEAEGLPPPVDGIKVAPAESFQDLPPGVEIPADVAAQLDLDRDGDTFADGMAIVPVGTGATDVYYITDSNYQAMIVLHSGGTGIVLVDAPEPLPFPNAAAGVPPFDIVTVLEDEFPGVPVTHLIYSHGHTDHIGGAHIIKTRWPGVTIHAHEETKKLLETVQDPKRPVPDVTFVDFESLNIGGQVIEQHYFGNTHQAGSTFIYLPDQKVLMVVDVIYPGWVPFRRLALSENIRVWLEAHDAVMQFNFHSLVSGHLTVIGENSSGTAAKKHAIWAKQYNDEIAASIEAGYEDITTLFEGANEIFAAGVDAFATNAKWALFSAFYDASTQRCVEALQNSTGDWKGRLAGEETFNFSNCEAYFVARRIGDVGPPE